MKTPLNNKPKHLPTVAEVAKDIHDHLAALYSDKPEKPAFIHRAYPYLHAMLFLIRPSDKYGLEDGEMIILHFLNAAIPWRGEYAKAKKALLNDLLESDPKATTFKERKNVKLGG